MNREDFRVFDSGLVYFDNGATTMKPNCVVEKITDYYTKYTANCHRGDYKNSMIVATISKPQEFQGFWGFRLIFQRFAVSAVLCSFVFLCVIF